MNERKEPGLDPAGLETLASEPASRPAASVTPASSSSSPSPAGGKGGSLLITLILLLLVAGVGYLGYALTEQQERFQELRHDLTLAQQRVEVLEELLEVTSDSAAQSGQTLQQRLEDLSGKAEERFSHFDSEIAKLWTIAYQRNKPQLETHTKQLKALEGGQSELNSALQQIRRQAGQAEEALTQAQAAKTAAAAVQKKLEAHLKGLEQQLSTLEQGLKVETEGRLKVQESLTRELAALKGGQGSEAELAQRVRQNEQAINAIDGTRRQINQELLRIRQQLNNLQLKVEQQ